MGGDHLSSGDSVDFSTLGAAEKGGVREHLMRVTDTWVAGGAQHIRLVVVDHGEVCVDTTIIEPAQHLTVREEYAGA